MLPGWTDAAGAHACHRGVYAPPWRSLAALTFECRPGIRALPWCMHTALVKSRCLGARPQPVRKRITLADKIITK